LTKDNSFIGNKILCGYFSGIRATIVCFAAINHIYLKISQIRAGLIALPTLGPAEKSGFFH